MQKDGSILISSNDFLNGMAASRYVGMEMIRNIDIDIQKGVARAAFKQVQDSAAPSSLYRLFAVDPNTGNVFLQEAAQGTTLTIRTADNAYTTIPGFTSSIPRGLCVFQDYLFRFYQTGTSMRADRYGPLSGTPSVSTNWGTFATAGVQSYLYAPGIIPAVVGQDNIMYVGIMNNVASISDATSSATINESALDLPTGYVIQSMSELGQNLMIGARYGTGVTTIGKIFPWDRVSSSFDFPIDTGSVGVPAMANQNNLLYALAGTSGQLVITNGSQVEQAKRIGDFTAEPEIGFSIYLNCIAPWNGGILIGLGKTTGTNRGPSGVYFYKNKRWTFYGLTLGDGSDGSAVEIGCIIPISEFKFLVSYSVGTTYAIDYVDTTKRNTSYTSYFDSQMYEVGTTLRDRTMLTGDFQLTQALSTGQGIKVAYRTNTSDSYTTIGTYDFSTLGAVTNHNFSADIPSCQNVQFRISLTCNSTGTATPELMYIRFI